MGDRRAATSQCRPPHPRWSTCRRSPMRCSPSTMQMRMERHPIRWCRLRKVTLTEKARWPLRARCSTSIRCRCSIKLYYSNRTWTGTLQAWVRPATVTTSTQLRWTPRVRCFWAVAARLFMGHTRISQPDPMTTFSIRNSRILVVRQAKLESSPAQAYTLAWQVIKSDVMRWARKAHLKCPSRATTWEEGFQESDYPIIRERPSMTKG